PRRKADRKHRMSDQSAGPQRIHIAGIGVAQSRRIRHRPELIDVIFERPQLFTNDTRVAWHGFAPLVRREFPQTISPYPYCHSRAATPCAWRLPREESRLFFTQYRQTREIPVVWTLVQSAP